MFELTVQVKNKLGQPTGKTKTVKSNSSVRISSFWNRYKGPLRGEKKVEK